MRLRRPELFLRQYQRLPLPLRKKADRIVLLLSQDIRHPGIRAKKVGNAADIWEARVDLHVRMTFRIEGDTLVFRKVGSHDMLRNP
jgi:mRNA interferase RelE/StbE